MKPNKVKYKPCETEINLMKSIQSHIKSNENHVETYENLIDSDKTT